MKRSSAARLWLLAALLGFALVHAEDRDGLRLNQVQLLGSHNSYKLPMPEERLAALGEIDTSLAQSLDYGHVPLAQQLGLGLRKLELDVFYDPRGSLFERARVPDTASTRRAGVALSASAFPVLHVQNLDDVSVCVNLLHCLAELVAWSAEHPHHLPVFVSFNAKDDVIGRPGFLRPEPFAEDAWLALDEELRGVLAGRLLTPAEVFQGDSLRWPSLKQVRGRVVAVLDEGGDKRRSYASRWRERAMFANLPEGEPGAAILVVNDPVADFARIRALVQAGYIVRTRADADTREARSGDTSRRDRAFASGAQLISTDYYLPADPFGTGYRVTLPGGGAAHASTSPAITASSPRVHRCAARSCRHQQASGSDENTKTQTLYRQPGSALPKNHAATATIHPPRR
jgi:hypothetical protein